MIFLAAISDKVFPLVAPQSLRRDDERTMRVQEMGLHSIPHPPSPQMVIEILSVASAMVRACG